MAGLVVPAVVRRRIVLACWAGCSGARVAAEFGVSTATVSRIMHDPVVIAELSVSSSARLDLAAREVISRGLAAGWSVRAIARELGRPASTVSREVNRNGGRHEYRAHRAQAATCQRGRRP